MNDGVREAPQSALDNLVRDAEAAGLKPLTDEQAEAMREKLRGVSAAMHGGNR